MHSTYCNFWHHCNCAHVSTWPTPDLANWMIVSLICWYHLHAVYWLFFRPWVRWMRRPGRRELSKTCRRSRGNSKYCSTIRAMGSRFWVNNITNKSGSKDHRMTTALNFSVVFPVYFLIFVHCIIFFFLVKLSTCWTCLWCVETFVLLFFWTITII